MLPGMFPSFITGGLSSLSIVNTVQAEGTGSSLALTIPTVQDGDLLILQCYGYRAAGANALFGNISGWTTIDAQENAAALAATWHYRIATAALSGTTVSGGAESGGGSAYNYKVLFVIRGNAVIASVTAGSVNGQWIATNPSAQTVTLSGATPGQPLIVLGAYNCVAGLVSPRTFTMSGVDAKDGELQRPTLVLNNDVWTAWKLFSAGDSLATPVAVDMDDEGVNILMSCYLQCAA